MASQRQTASHGSYSFGSQIDIPLCDCNESTVLKMSLTNANPGRRFFGCPRFGVSLHLFGYELIYGFDFGIEKCK